MKTKAVQRWKNYSEVDFQYSKVLNVAKTRKEYFVFSGKDLDIAKTFLMNNPVFSRAVYLVVITPVGILCADMDGIEQIPLMNF